MGWEVIAILIRDEADIKYLDSKLSEGWEPFTVTRDGMSSYSYHLRRQIEL